MSLLLGATAEWPNGTTMVERWVDRPRGRAACHPDRRHYGNGFCRPCYRMLWTSPTPARCHPERRQKARGLCGECYERANRAERSGRAPRLRRLAQCHPDRPHFAKGQCEPCWRYDYERTGRGRDTRLAHQAGLPLGQYEAVLASQGGRCAICQGDGGGRAFHADHDHATDQFRGLICGNCNAVLGHAKDDPAVLQAAIDYLLRGGIPWTL